VGTCRPDFLLYVNDILLFKGEEKAVKDDFNNAKDDLSKKFSTLDPLFFGDVKFLMCYAAAGSKLGFFAIDGFTGNLVPLTNLFDLHAPESRFMVIETIINIVRILNTMIPHLPTDVIPLGKPLKYGKSTTITFDTLTVVKELPIDDLPYTKEDAKKRIQLLQSMYECAKDYSGLVQVDKLPTTYISNGRKFYKLVMKTRGRRIPPTNEDECRVMTKDLLKGLLRLHQNSFFHRDIRMSNILRVSDNNCTYSLIDFEHGGREATFGADEMLTGWDCNTLTGNNRYTSRSDIYQLGKLLLGTNLVMSQNGRNFIDTLLAKKTGAGVALSHHWFQGL